jgi:hypothetical protein
MGLVLNLPREGNKLLDSPDTWTDFGDTSQTVREQRPSRRLGWAQGRVHR